MPFTPTTWIDGTTAITATELNRMEAGIADALTETLATWTPTLTAASAAPSVTYGNQYGVYVQMGRLVWVSFTLSWTARASAGVGGLQVSGLPFTFDVAAPIGAFYPLGTVGLGGFTFPTNYTYAALGARNGTSNFEMTFFGSGQLPFAATDAHLPTAGSINGTIITRVAA